MLEKQDYGCDDEGKEKVGLVRVRKTLTMTMPLLILGLLAVVIIFRHMLISQSVIDSDSENVSPSHFGLASSTLHWIPMAPDSNAPISPSLSTTSTIPTNEPLQ